MNNPCPHIRRYIGFLALMLCASMVSAAPAVASGVQPSAPPPSNVNNKPLMNTLPLFYQSLVAFNQDQHGKLSFPDRAPDYGFAAQANIIPLLINEVSQAVRHYPLVFIPGAEGEPPALAAMVSAGDGVNRFIGLDKQWRGDAYLPAYVRQYPFLAVRTPDGKDAVLGIDDRAGWLGATGGEAFISADGKPTQRLERTIAFAREFQRLAERTNAIVLALQEAGVLEQGVLRLEPKGGGEPRQISGFLIVSEAKLNALSDEVVLKLHKSGAMGLAYTQMLSMGNLPNLLRPDEAVKTETSARKKAGKRSP